MDVLRKTLRLIGQERRARWVALVFLAILASGLEMLGAVLVYFLLAMVAGAGLDVELPFVGEVTQYFGDVDESTLMVGIAAAMAVFFLARAGLQIFVTYAQKRVAHTTGARLASRLADGYLALPYAFHLHRNTSESVRNANAASTQVVASALLPLISVAADGILTVSLLTVMLLVSPAATGLAVLVVGGTVLTILFVVQPRLKRLGERAVWLNRETLKAMVQALEGLRDIKTLGRERFFGGRYRYGVDELARTAYLRGTASELPRVGMETALIVFILFFFGFAVATDMASEEILSILGLFAYAGLRLQPSLARLIGSLNELKYASAAVNRVLEDLDLIDDVRLEPDGLERPFEREIVLDRVSFRYEGAETNALTDVSMRIGSRETIGICGPTGGGKTTLVDLMTGLLTPTGGRITVDGHDLSDGVRWWQANLGVVPQMVFLTDDRLRRNIAFGVPDDEIDPDALDEAVRLAQLEEFVERLPEGLETKVGERGVRVSGGQRQRIAIARALYRRSRVLVFDEGTSALDNLTEAQLMAALERLRGKYTIILVAHRLSTVRSCDRIVFVQHGRVAGVGSYDELVEANEGFRALTLSR